MYIGNFEVDEIMGGRSDNFKFKIVFIFPEGVVPKSVPIPSAVRKENTLTFLFRARPAKDELERVVKMANSDYVNPCPHITDRFGGLRYYCYEWIETPGTWSLIKNDTN